MTLLVLCIDRDNDFGRKAGVRGPIVGREANLDAAMQLGVSDPEDSDTNSVFGAVNLYDSLKAEGEDVELVTLCGDGNVGTVSDRIITRQLEDVLDAVPATSCVFVTDGAEDEYLLPLVASRIKVEAVRRVIVKQNADIEGTYYVIKRALEDEKMQRTFVMPLALGLLVYGLFAVSGVPDKGIGAISLTLGTYFLVKVLHLEASIHNVLDDIYTGLTTGKVSLFTSMLSLLILIGGAITAANAVIRFGSNAKLIQYALVVGDVIIWWVVVATLIAAAGKVLDAYLRDGVVLWGYWMLPFSLVALGFIVGAVVDIIKALIASDTLLAPATIIDLILGFVIAFIGVATFTYVRETFDEDEGRGPGGDGGETGGREGAEAAPDDGRSRSRAAASAGDPVAVEPGRR